MPDSLAARFICFRLILICISVETTEKATVIATMTTEGTARAGA